jgi:hypothetical protein
VDNIVQGEDVLVLQFHERDFADGGARGTFFRIETDLRESYKLAGFAVPSFEDLLLLVRQP